MSGLPVSMEAKQPLTALFYILPIIVPLVGIPASIFAYSATKNSVARVAQLQFDREADAANSALENRLQSYSYILYSMRALFDTEPQVDRAKFHRFVKSLELHDRYPGFMALNFAQYVLEKDKRAFEYSVRKDTSVDVGGYPTFSIKPPGDRSEYFVITYLEPMKGYEFAFGLDMSANPMATDLKRVASALRLGRDTGKLLASAQPIRVQQERERIFLSMRLAVYRSGWSLDSVEQRRGAYIGSVGAAFDVESVLQAALNTNTLQRIRCRLFDAGVATEGDERRDSVQRRLLFDTKLHVEGADESNPDARPGITLTYNDQIVIADRKWDIEYSVPQEAVLSGLDRWLAPIALGAGLVATFLLFGIVLALTTSRRRALAIADNITRDLRDSEQGLAQAQRIAQMGNWALDPVAWQMGWSDETYRLFGLDPATMPQNYAQYLQRIYAEDRPAVDRQLRHALAANEDVSFEHRIVLPDASVRWVLTSARPTARNRQGHMPGVMLDISDRKRTEGELKHSHEQLQYLSWQLVEAQESERRRIARELHDVVGQNLTALGINMHIVQAQLAQAKNSVAERRVADSAELLQSTTQAIEGVMSDLRPPMLDDYGLLSALQWYARQYSERTGIAVKTIGEESMPRLAATAELALFRVVQEALNNVAKHAQASKVEIQVERDEAQVILSVTDDGRGMEAALALPATQSRRRPGLGMITMRERIQTFGGTVVVQKAAGGGTRVEFRIPF